MGILADRVRELREGLGLSQQELAQRAGMTQQGIQAIEKGKVGRPTKIRELARALRARPEYLLGESGADFERDYTDPAAPEPIDPDRVDTIGSETPSNLPPGALPQLDVTAGMGAGGFVLTAEGVAGKAGMTFAAEYISGYWLLPDQIVSSLGIRGKDTIIIPCMGNSMAPTLLEGDMVFVDTRHRWPSPDGIYALADDFGGIIVKTLRTADSDGGEGPYIEIVSDNPDQVRYPPKLRRADELRIIGRVVRRFSAVF